jgi:hypothetical protein
VDSGFDSSALTKLLFSRVASSEAKSEYGPEPQSIVARQLMGSTHNVISLTSLGVSEFSNIDLPRPQKVKEAYSSVATRLRNAEQHKIIAHTLR